MARSRRAVLGTLATFGAGLAAGCTGSSDSPSGGDTTGTATPTATAEPEPSVTDVSLLLNWKPSGLHAPYYAAKAEGFYEAEGFDSVTLKSGQGSDFSAQQAGLGNEEFVVTSADQVLNVNSKDLSPQSVGVVMQRSPVVLFSAREQFGSELTSVDQLAGGKVGTGPGMVRIMTKVLLEQKGVLSDVEIVDTGYDTVQKLLTGDIDAAGGVFGDVIDARHQDYTIDQIPVASSVPSYGHVIATKQGFASGNAETVRAFLRATARGAVWAGENPEAATDHLVSAVPSLEESRTRQRDRWQMMHDQFMGAGSDGVRAWGWHQSDPWETMEGALTDAGTIDGDVDPASVWTNDYLDTDDEYVGGFGSE